MPILLKTQIERTAKAPIPACHARVGSLCDFRGTAERVPAGSPKTGRCANVREWCRNAKRRKRTAAGGFRQREKPQAAKQEILQKLPASFGAGGCRVHPQRHHQPDIKAAAPIRRRPAHIAQRLTAAIAVKRNLQRRTQPHIAANQLPVHNPLRHIFVGAVSPIIAPGLQRRLQNLTKFRCVQIELCMFIVD